MGIARLYKQSAAVSACSSPLPLSSPSEVDTHPPSSTARWPGQSSSSSCRQEAQYRWISAPLSTDHLNRALLTQPTTTTTTTTTAHHFGRTPHWTRSRLVLSLPLEDLPQLGRRPRAFGSRGIFGLEGGRRRRRGAADECAWGLAWVRDETAAFPRADSPPESLTSWLDVRIHKERVGLSVQDVIVQREEIRWRLEEVVVPAIAAWSDLMRERRQREKKHLRVSARTKDSMLSIGLVDERATPEGQPSAHVHSFIREHQLT